ncbi:MAG: alpha/beta hydrolase family protein [Chthoniobacterales bacterium]
MISPDCRLLVLFHGYGAPASPSELARALPLPGLNAVLAYVNLPMVAGRLPVGGLDALRRLQKQNFVNGFFFPSISGAAHELRPIVDQIASAYHLEVKNGIGLFGFSAGGAAALLSLMESDVPVHAAVIVNAPMSVAQNVENWEHTLGLHFAWDDASHRAALRYDIGAQAARIARRQPLPALLLLRGEADKSLGLDPAQRAYEQLRSAYTAHDGANRVELQTVPGLGHQFGPDAKASPSEPASDAAELPARIEQWFQKFLKLAKLEK